MSEANAINELTRLNDEFVKSLEDLKENHIKESRKIIYRNIVKSLVVKRSGFFGWLARLFKHPYGYVLNLSAEDKTKLEALAREWLK